jgi:CRP-like cAMP-binding protein
VEDVPVVDGQIFSSGNVLLEQLEPDVLARFAGQLRQVEMSKGDVLQQEGETVETVYFPVHGLIGLMSDTASGQSVESATVGWDGALCAFEACGSRKSLARATVQIPGTAWRMSAANYREMYVASEALRTVMHKYVELVLAEARQFVACNAIHDVENRLCRAILDAFYRSGATQVLPLTQESLAQILGVQRTTVAQAMSNLQRAGILRSGRAAIEVLDQANLERMACDCHATLRVVRQEIYATRAPVCEAS